ncbi:3-oxoadipate enol-lactonase [Loktanella sp. D2R18]|uniref:3-oxoadipate enol-lactonase n=1 Tax=Rhodobacterales TaxID=204455 RepID=UPI000DE8D407|nr:MULTISPECIES: 3-oxoadipate enol-lactonase [Rhodobacterales]MDO6588972.1 3-oxoadipate enol-lactonase [Yoonia sp. 1_MG-2023]RBW41811.1 3-oxoadipate enol-lactonase [Loktanella sp. D2R18]
MNERTQVDRDDVKLNVLAEGPADGPAIVFANSLGTDLRLWDGIVPLLPRGLRVIRYDMRGHGQSDVPAGPYTMGQLVSDAEAVCDGFDLRDVLFVGLSVGGMVAQGLAIKRPDLVRALVLSNTAAKIGNKKLWQDRIDTVLSKGLDAMADEVMKRWFSPNFYASESMLAWRDMLVATPLSGYVGICHAIAGTDFYTPTSGLRIPTLGIAGSDDGATPPDLVRETIDLIPGSKFELIRRVGHLPCAENPVGYASLLNTFIQDIGHG